ncbi:hypothetical protein LCGC14_1141950 [marine sediment metagenome]|uniref:Uncharacterized protein n=1 Tax=marine sediment metagenome TaxID=412755 RepID=A0A0F9Q3S4_9ZZZZ
MAATLLPNGRWYTTRDSFKRTIMDNTAVTDKDNRLDEAIASASEFIEEYTDRLFIPWTGAKEFDYQKIGKLHLGEDLLSVTSITYADGDQTVNSGDYFLYPLNAADRSKPYQWIELLLSDDQFFYKDTRQKDIAITGKWGYSEITKLLTTLNHGATVNATETAITVTAGTNFEIGMTLLCETEQWFVGNVATNVITVIRGVNGTTAATHVDTTAVYAIFPPLQIRQAANALAARAFMRGESQWTDRAKTQGSDLSFSYFKAMPAEIEAILKKYRREVVI